MLSKVKDFYVHTYRNKEKKNKEKIIASYKKHKKKRKTECGGHH